MGPRLAGRLQCHGLDPAFAGQLIGHLHYNAIPAAPVQRPICHDPEKGYQRGSHLPRYNLQS